MTTSSVRVTRGLRICFHFHRSLKDKNFHTQTRRGIRRVWFDVLVDSMKSHIATAREKSARRRHGSWAKFYRCQNRLFFCNSVMKVLDPLCCCWWGYIYIGIVYTLHWMLVAGSWSTKGAIDNWNIVVTNSTVSAEKTYAWHKRSSVVAISVQCLSIRIFVLNSLERIKRIKSTNKEYSFH